MKDGTERGWLPGETEEKEDMDGWDGTESGCKGGAKQRERKTSEMERSRKKQTQRHICK